MLTLETLAEQHRVPIKRDACGDRIIRGKNGHLYVDEGVIYVCYTDDGRKHPLTMRRKTAAKTKLGDGILRMKQEGEAEFIAEISTEAVATALFPVLGVRRFKVTKGVHKPFPTPQKNGGFEPQNRSEGAGASGGLFPDTD
jgi:hypothetical protein